MFFALCFGCFAIKSRHFEYRSFRYSAIPNDPHSSTIGFNGTANSLAEQQQQQQQIPMMANPQCTIFWEILKIFLYSQYNFFIDSHIPMPE
jgi:hypothetical protein